MAQRLIAYRKNGKSEDLVVELEQIYSEDGGMTIVGTSETNTTIYGPVASGMVFHIKNILATSRGGDGGDGRIRFFREAGVTQPIFPDVNVGLSETVYLDCIAGALVASGYYIEAYVQGFNTLPIHVGGILRKQDSHGK